MLKLIVLLLVSFLARESRAFLDTEDKSWLVALVTDDPKKWPLNTFDQQNCSHPPVFNGCHGVMMTNGIAMTTRSCLGFHQDRLPRLFIKQNALDDHYFKEHGSQRKLSKYVHYIPLKHCGNHKNECRRDLVLVRFPSVPLVMPLTQPPSGFSVDDSSVQCRIFGWAVWGNQRDNFPAYQMFSMPVKFVDPRVCRQSYIGHDTEHDSAMHIRNADLCLDNSEGRMCPKNMNGAPVVCTFNGHEYLVGLAKSRNNLIRPAPIVVSNVMELSLRLMEDFESGVIDATINANDPELAFERTNNAFKAIQNYFIFILTISLIALK